MGQKAALLPRHPVACLSVTVGVSSVQRYVTSLRSIMDLNSSQQLALQHDYHTLMGKMISCQCQGKIIDRLAGPPYNDRCA